MKLADIAHIRLFSQQISGTNFNTVKDIVGWMGAMQAQDYSMAKWAIGARLPGSTEETVEAAIDRGEILRTHLLRPTWHFVSADDIYWMLELTAPQIKARLKYRHKQLELTEKIVARSSSIIENALAGGRHLTREELITELEKAKIATDNSRMYHLMLRAELDGVVCSGAPGGKKQIYALLRERVPEQKTLNRDEALAKLAYKYFSSRCPATLQDFVWWSGLSVTQAKHALEMIKSNFVSEKTGSQTYWLSNSFSIPANPEQKSVHLLPAFDEFIISYKDRTASLPLENHQKAVSNNGVFWPIIVVNGKVAGTWKRTITKEHIIVETDFFQSSDQATWRLLEKACTAFGNFLNKRAALHGK